MNRLFVLALLAFSIFPAWGQDPPAPTAPVITWAAPAPIRNPAPLGEEQLNARADVPGTFMYDPPAGTVLDVGDNQTISVTFTPDDAEAYTQAAATVFVNVIPTYWPYDPSETAYVCHVNPDMSPILDPTTLQPRCFVVPPPVSVAITKHMLTQTNGLNQDGTVAYKYASWWDYIVKFFIGELVNPMLDKYPPPGVAEAKANAAAAAAAVDAAKAALLQQQQQ